jgi:hypothetical protein
MSQFGQQLGASQTQVDSAVSVSAGGSANGTSVDIGAATSPQATSVTAQFGLTQAGTTNSAALTVLVQYSHDNSTWPDSGEGSPIYSWKAGSAGADLTRGSLVSFVPQARYFRFVYQNGNGTDSFTVNGWYALNYLQDDN